VFRWRCTRKAVELFFVCEEGWIPQKIRLEKEKVFVCGLRIKLHFYYTVQTQTHLSNEADM
jgi:hypothetical protein